MTAAPDLGSFRDPSGFVFTHDRTLYRQVNEAYRPHYEHLRDSGLYDALVGRGLLVAHAEEPLSVAPQPGAYRVLRPEAVPFVSYPYEWCFSQLRDAALATLTIQQAALDHGMSLRDASAYNIQFRHGRPVLIDTLSFEVLPEGRPWVAYRQFCQHFLSPLALMSLIDVRLGQLLRVHLDGIPLDLAAALLSRRTRLRPGLLLHLHQHAKSQQRHAVGGVSHDRATGRFSLQAFRGLVESLATTVRKLDWQPPRSAWSDYYEGDSYTPDALAAKEQLVEAFLDEVTPHTVWDLGANTGRFSRLASKRKAFTVSFEMDPASVEISYRQLRTHDEANLLPLVCDLINPSPALGWAGGERRSLAGRGPAELVMALALVHHLAIANNVPLDRVADYLADLGNWLVIEFIPKGDPKVQLLLRSRDDIFAGYDRDRFERAFGARFRICRREAIGGSGRTLYLMQGRRTRR